MMTKARLLEKISAFASGGMGLAEFNSWLMPRVWDIDSDGTDAETRDVVYGVKLWLAEYDRGHRTLDEVREMCWGL